MSPLRWQGAQLRQALVAQAIAAVDEINLRIEAGAKAELYPGHGKLTGTLQRDIQAQPARLEGRVVRGRVGTRRLPYAMVIHRRYKYLTTPLERVRPQAGAILAKHRRGGR